MVSNFSFTSCLMVIHLARNLTKQGLLMHMFLITETYIDKTNEEKILPNLNCRRTSFKTGTIKDLPRAINPISITK